MRQIADKVAQLIEDAGIRDLVVARVFSQDDPGKRAYVVVRLDAIDFTTQIDSDIGETDKSRIEITCWAKDLERSWEVAEQVRKLIHGAFDFSVLADVAEIDSLNVGTTLYGVQMMWLLS